MNDTKNTNKELREFDTFHQRSRGNRSEAFIAMDINEPHEIKDKPNRRPLRTL